MIRLGPIQTLVLPWLALLALLAATVTGAYMPLGRLNLALALAIACTKALIVIVAFMKVRAGPPLTIVFAAAGFFWLMILFGLAGADYLTRAWTPPT